MLLVLLDATYAPLVIWRAPRDKVIEELRKPGSRSRNERGQMSISQFKRTSTLAWDRTRAEIANG